MSHEPDPVIGMRGALRVDRSPDARFYDRPRLVAHIDDGAIAAVTDHIRRLVPTDVPILDLMSSYHSHLPTDVSFGPVTGLGMNADELAANSQLASYAVHDVNIDPRLPFPDEEFGAALCTVSVQYLTRPVAVFTDVRRVLASSAPFVVFFSNRCFPHKAVHAWQERDDAGHAELIRDYFRTAGGWSEPESSAGVPKCGDPLYAVWSYRVA